jgi:hypothetical protein
MKTQKKPSSICLPVWIDVAVRDLAQKHKRSMNGEIEFLVEEALKNEGIKFSPLYVDRNSVPMGEVALTGEATA